MTNVGNIVKLQNSARQATSVAKLFAFRFFDIFIYGVKD